MNIKILHSWLLEFLDTNATPQQIQKYVSLCGPSIENIEKIDEDWIYDIEITSNRVDTVSVVGIAREIATILNRSNIPAIFKKPIIQQPEKPKQILPFSIRDDNKLTKRLMAIVMDNIKVDKSPDFITKRLEASGIRSLSNLIDITNYVMLEIGHPTHVFDYDRIKTKTFILRNANKGEKIITLDNKTYELFDTDIIIDDGSDRIIDFPGIMGTANSVVTNETKRIVFFIESNNPQAIRKSSMKHGIRTIAASINEKNPHPDLVKDALYRGISLFQMYAKAHIASNVFDIYPEVPSIKKILIDMSFIHKKIGVSIEKKQIVSILQDLEFDIVENKDNFEITVPSFRYFDISDKEDIIEEVARIYGYHNIPGQLPPMAYIMQPSDIEAIFYYQNIVKTFFKHQSFHETMNYSAYSKSLLEKNNFKDTDHLHITNTISEDIKYLRLSLIPSLLKNLKDNEGYAPNLNAFEIAKTYIPKGGDLPEEQFKLSFATKRSFLYLKGIIESLLKEMHIEHFIFETSTMPIFDQHIQANLTVNNVRVGSFGRISNSIVDNMQLSTPVFAAEFDFAKLIESARLMPNYKPYSPYAAIHLDLTTPHNQPYAQLVKIAKKSAPHLSQITLKDIYKNNITLHLIFASPNRNYTEKEALVELESINKLLKT